MMPNRYSNNYFSSRLLVVVAHPDDEVLGCAGLLLENYYNGGENYVLYLNDGCQYRDNNDKTEIRRQIKEVADLLKFTPLIEKFTSSQFDSYNQVEINNVVQKYVNSIAPTVVVTHIHNDLHQDHVVVNKATMVACRFTPKNKVKSILEMPVISSSEINPQFSFAPNLFLDITDFIEIKKQAIQKYVFEVQSFSELRGDNGIEGWGIFYGMHIGVRYAEAFKLVRGSL